MSQEGKLLVSVVSGHVVIEDQTGAVAYDIPCKSTVDATMLASSLANHSVNMMDKKLFIKPKSKK